MRPITDASSLSIWVSSRRRNATSGRETTNARSSDKRSACALTARAGRSALCHVQTLFGLTARIRAVLVWTPGRRKWDEANWVPVDTLCDFFGPEREHPLNKPCTGLVVHSDPKARSTLKSVNGNTAPSCRTSAPPDRVPESCQSAKLLATYWMGEWVDFRLGTGAPTADFEPPANCLPFWPYRRQREPDDLV